MWKWILQQWNDIKGNAKWDTIKLLISGGCAGLITGIYRAIASLLNHHSDVLLTLVIFVISAACLYFALIRPSRRIVNAERQPGFSLYAVIRLLPQSISRRKYILDFGGRDNERLSVYVTADNIFTFSFVDAKSEPHSVQVPLGLNGVPLGRFFILGCEVGVFHTYTLMKVEIDGSIKRTLKLDFRVDIGSLDIPGSVIGANLSGEDHGKFDIQVLALAHSTLPRQVFLNLEKYVGASGEKHQLEFRGSQWLRANDVASGSVKDTKQPPNHIPTPQDKIDEARKLFTLPEGKLTLNLVERNEQGSYNIYSDQNDNRSWEFNPIRKGVIFTTKASSNRVVYVQGPLKPTIHGIHQIIMEWNSRGGSLHIDGEGRGDFDPESNV